MSFLLGFLCNIMSLLFYEQKQLVNLSIDILIFHFRAT